jgi:hypothetical protein
MSSFTFLSWARAGISASLPPLVGPLDTASAAARITVGVTVSTDSAPDATATATVRLLGPGDVTGLIASQIVRSDPPGGAQAFPPNLFPCVEFDRPDLPWAFTPAGASGEKLQPWLVLVVVPAAEAQLTDATATGPARLTTPAAHLPPLGDAWAWAHVAVARPAAAVGDVNAIQRNDPDAVISRLMCPRQLDAQTDYVGCVVPSFLAGVQAGLGGPVTTTTLVPAWDSTSATQVTLPVYHAFSFRTGEAGDFRSLALSMRRRVLPAEASTRPVDISHPGSDLPAAPDGTTTGLEGALRVPDAPETDWPEAVRTPFQDALTGLLDAGSRPADGGGHVLGPPLYGRWLAAHATVPAATGAAGRPVWLRTLNVDPRHRMVAGIAARTIQRHAQTLLAQAWEQIDQVNAANALLRGAQLARTRAARAWQRIGALDAPVRIALAGPAFARTRVGARTASGEVGASSYPAGLLTGAARRIGRPRGPLGRRLGIQPGAAVRAAADPAATAVGGAPTPWAVWRGRHSAAQIQRAPVRDGFVPLGAKDPAPDSRGLPVALGNPLAEALRTAAVTIAADQVTLLKAGHDRPALDLGTLAASMLTALDPEQTVTARIASRVSVPARPAGADPLDPVLAVPRFPQPMWETLDETSRELLFPGLARIPRETVTALETNPRFVEAFLVGANHELGAQLLFAGYPTDQRGTGFRQFWDVRGRVPAPATPDDAHDIEAISDWRKDADLGENMSQHGAGNLVLVLRGELLRRYPELTVYAVPATTVSPRPRAIDTDPSHERYPLFTGRLGDVAFYGFDMTADGARGSEANGEPGFYFVLQQHAIAPHFGLLASAEGDAGQAPQDAGELSWGNVATAGADGKPVPMTYAPLTPGGAWFAGYTWPGPVWGADAASQAALCLQHPVRVAIHAEELLPT